MSVIRLSNAILLQRSAGNPAEITPAIFLFLKEIASANRAILYTYGGRGFALMDAVVFAATTAGARRAQAPPGCNSCSLSLYICLRMCNNPRFKRGPSWPRRDRQLRQRRSLDLENPGPFNSEQMFQVAPTAKSHQKSPFRGRGQVSGWAVCMAAAWGAWDGAGQCWGGL